MLTTRNTIVVGNTNDVMFGAPAKKAPKRTGGEKGGTSAARENGMIQCLKYI